MASSQNPPPPKGAHNVPVLSVGELAQALKRTVEDSFPLVRVRGEVSGFKRHSSGHVYFRLKDETAVLEAVCWRGTALKLGIAVEDGLDVVISGRLTTYANRSQYQIVVDAIELAGEGALLKLLEDRKKKLAAEGLFDAARKVALPFLPAVIGVVTSPTGAVIRDILHRLRDRFPRRVLLWPVQVQGPGAAEQVAAAIAGFNRLEAGGAVPRPDVLIVARGGGSLEDLWAFNEEVVVRAVAASDIPLIAAVGHETDTTLIDFAADVRAPTPTAAAEMAVPVRLELMEGVLDLAHRLTACTARNLADRRAALAAGARGLPNLKRLLDASAQRLDEWAERLPQGLRNHVAAKRARVAALIAALPDPKREIALARRHFAQIAGRLAQPMRVRLAAATERLARFGDLLESLSYTRSLARGFVLVRAGERPLTRAHDLKPGLDVTLTFSDGEAGARITAVGGAPPSPLGPPRRRRPPSGGTPGGSQGELL